MFKLYADNCGWEKVGISPKENEILSTMIWYTNKFDLYRFMIISHDDKINCDIPYKLIGSEKDFKEYLLDCKERNIELITSKKKKKKGKKLKIDGYI